MDNMLNENTEKKPIIINESDYDKSSFVQIKLNKSIEALKMVFDTNRTISNKNAKKLLEKAFPGHSATEMVAFMNTLQTWYKNYTILRDELVLEDNVELNESYVVVTEDYSGYEKFIQDYIDNIPTMDIISLESDLEVFKKSDFEDDKKLASLLQIELDKRR